MRLIWKIAETGKSFCNLFL